MTLERSLEKVKSLETTFDDYQVEIGWDLTMHCNYSCTYCNSYDNSQPTHLLPLEDYIKAANYMNHHIGNKTARIQLCGGEPMLFKHWNILLDELSDLGFHPTIISNLSLPLKTLKQKIKNLKTKNSIEVSWHPQFAVTDEIVDKINLLYNTEHLRSISILADTRYWSVVNEAFEKVKYTDKAVISIIKDEKSDATSIASKLYEYSEDQINFMNKANKTNKSSFTTTVTTENDQFNINSVSKFFEMGICNFKGFKCEIGTTTFHIKANGDVYPSACMFNYPKAKMGNVFKENIKKVKNPIICPFTFCGCGPDLRIKKYR